MDKKQTIEEFLARGGEIKVIPPGVSNAPEAKQLKGEQVRDLYRQKKYRKAPSKQET